MDLESIGELAQTQVRNKAAIALPTDIQPVETYPREPDASRRPLYQQAEQRGHELLRQGKVAAFLVAGGQGTRLGYDGPKGEYPVTPIKNKPLFQVFAEQLLAHCRDAGNPIPWYVMTSDINDAATRAFFVKHNYFGYDPGQIFFFPQGMMPAFSMNGELLLAEKDSLPSAPTAMADRSAPSIRAVRLADMRKRGDRAPVLLPGRQPAGPLHRPAVPRPARPDRQRDEQQDHPQGQRAGESRQLRRRRRRGAGDRVQRSARSAGAADQHRRHPAI